MPQVIIRGSISPSTYLARGEVRGPIELTPAIRKLIAGGFVDVVETIPDAPTSASVSKKSARTRRKTVEDLPQSDADESNG